MPQTYAAATVDLRSRLDEKGVQRFWLDSDLQAWLVEGCRYVARSTETLFGYADSVTSVTGESEYPAPTDAIKLHRVEYIPTNTANPSQVIPLIMKSMYEMDQLWGSVPYWQGIYPQYSVPLGTPNGGGNQARGLFFKVFPVPSQAGTFRVYYWAMPNINPAATDFLPIYEGYENIPKLYAEHVALRADRDPRWQEARQLFEQDLADMIRETRRLHDQTGEITFGVGTLGYGSVPYAAGGLLGGWS